MRRFLSALLLAMTLHAATHAQEPAQPIVLSVDDGPSLAATPRFSPARRHQALLDTLARHRITAVLYVTLDFGADREEGLDMALQWGEAGHLLGNHTVTHLDLHDPAVTLVRYQDEILRCDEAMSSLPGWRRWFRHTFLHEGDTAGKREGLRRFLAAQGYRPAPVDLDSRDWQFDPRLSARLLDPQADDSALKQAFLAQLREQARTLRQQGPVPGAADAARVLLVHHNLAMALWLDDVIRLFQEEGFVFVHPDAAFVGPTPLRR